MLLLLQNVDFAGLFDVLSSKPVLNKVTFAASSVWLLFCIVFCIVVYFIVVYLYCNFVLYAFSYLLSFDCLIEFQSFIFIKVSIVQNSSLFFYVDDTMLLKAYVIYQLVLKYSNFFCSIHMNNIIDSRLQATTYTTLMQVDSGSMETYIQYCPDPCAPGVSATLYMQ